MLETENGKKRVRLLDGRKEYRAGNGKNNSWLWKYKDNSVNIYYEEHDKGSDEPCQNILLIPTIADVSIVEEWRSVSLIDPKLDYSADVMEKFLVDFINAPDGPVNNSDKDLVVFGGGHAATIAVHAAKKGLVKPTAIASIAPTWAGPLPIVFGRDTSMETRHYKAKPNVGNKRTSRFEHCVMRTKLGFKWTRVEGQAHYPRVSKSAVGTLRALAVGWMMYNVLVSNEKSIQSQYKSHVYADPGKATQDIIDSRYALTKRQGARYVPAAFLTGLLDPVKSREGFFQLFAELEGRIPVLVLATAGSPKRSKAEMEALREAKGVSKYVEVPGALLPQEEYPEIVTERPSHS
ncbi:hypothetical protein RND71_029592 [Anisodus tanguticus]|uniref:Uncharacterized protein n=1 Tax=Anisodus tanguticus TaxID=243964 RepID=A0AAE1RDM2_9SOLA|nr:hypothetical protein RND71_029592 [Anisodus tanguticus]